MLGRLILWVDCCRYLIPATAAAHSVRILSLFAQIVLDSDHLHAARHHLSSKDPRLLTYISTLKIDGMLPCLTHLIHEDSSSLPMPAAISSEQL